MTSVFIWNFRGSAAGWGHASMLVDGGSPPGANYYSWWPSGADRTRKLPLTSSVIPPLANVYTARAILGRSFEDDMRGEAEGLRVAMLPPDHTVAITGLKESAIKAWWDRLIATNPLWKTLNQNCSTTVARALEAGGGDTHASWWSSWNTVWHPNDVLQYALSIQKGLAQAHAGR
jgi:hypothetical protein